MSIRIKPGERDAVIKSLAAGVVPTTGLHHLQVGRKDEIMAVLGDLGRIEEGGATIRFVIGKYGAGKSFFLNLIKSVAIAKKFIVMQADITIKRRLASTTGYARALYAELVAGMSCGASPEGGAFDVVMEKWARVLAEEYPRDFDAEEAVREKLKPLQDMPGGFAFISAAAKYCKAALEGNEKKTRAAKKWFGGAYGKVTEAKTELEAESFINDKDIYDYLKIWGVFARLAGYSGLLVMMDEMGLLAQTASNNTSRDSNYEVILQILNDCLQGRVSGAGFIFAGTDLFLDDPKNGLMGHGALASRLAPNPFARDGLVDLSSPVIRLGEFTPEDMYLLLENIREIFAMGDRSKYLIPDEAVQDFMNLCAWSLGGDFYKTPRDAVKLFTGFLSVLQQNPGAEWRSILSGAVIEKSGSGITPVEAPSLDTSLDGEGEYPDAEVSGRRKIEFAMESEPGYENETENGGEEIQNEPAQSDEETEPDFYPSLLEPERGFERIFEPAITLRPTHITGPEAESSREKTPGLEPDAALSGETEAGTKEESPDVSAFEFDFGPDAAVSPGYSSEPSFETGPGPELFASEPHLEMSDPNILYILPDAGSSRDMPLRLVRAERTGLLPEAAGSHSAAPSPDFFVKDEEDMRVGHVLYGNENDLKVFLPNMISRNPLIGTERISQGVHNDLVRMSGKILINAYNNYLPNGYEKMLLAVTLVNIAKRWMSDDEEAFWNFIGRQLGFEKESRDALHGAMCNAVFETMRSHHRFFSYDRKNNKREFFTTIMAHAFAAKQSIFSLFDFLMEFYWENLRGRVIKGDSALTVMTAELRRRFEETAEPGKTVLKGKYSGIGAGLAAVIMKRPIFFRKFSEEILIKLDGLARGLRLRNVTYIDELLNSWFICKTPLETARETFQTGKKLPSAVSYDEIRPRYEIEGANSVVLVIPSIRLEADSPGKEAAAVIVCGDTRRLVSLDLCGDEFARSVTEKRIMLSGLSRFEVSKDLMIKVNISIDGKSVYDSGTSLFRDIIVFGEEEEIPLQNVNEGLYSVFTTSDRSLGFDESADDRVIPAESGQMRAVKFSEKYGIMLDGHVVCTSSGDEPLTVKISAPPCGEATFLRRGNEYRIYSGKFYVTARVPKGHNLARYAFRLGSRDIPFRDCVSGNFEDMAECTVEAAPEKLKDGLFDLIVTDSGRNREEIYRICCCLIEGFTVSFDRPYYFGDASDGTVRIETDSRRVERSLGNGDSVIVPFGDGDVKIQIPVVRWRICPPLPDEGNNKRGMLWHASLSPDTKLEVTCPDEVLCKLKLGDNTIECEHREDKGAIFNLGDCLRKAEFGRDEEIAQAGLLLESSDDNSVREIFPICLKETFEENPKFEMRDGVLSVKNHWAFIGPPDAKLEYSFKGRTGESYIVTAGDSVITEKCELPHGNYQYRVLTVSGDEKSPEKKVIISGSCTLGDVDIFHFDNKVLEIRRVRAGFKEFFILPVYVENLEFVEMAARYDDGVSYPVYRGVCYCLNRDDEKVYFGDKFNPAQVVIINGRDICLYKKDGSKPYLVYDSRHKIVSEAPDPRSGIVHYVPDFYEYEATQGN